MLHGRMITDDVPDRLWLRLNRRSIRPGWSHVTRRVRLSCQRNWFVPRLHHPLLWWLVLLEFLVMHRVLFLLLLKTRGRPFRYPNRVTLWRWFDSWLPLPGFSLFLRPLRLLGRHHDRLLNL